ncbi:MAG TPA: DUF4349 domain-containing protein [Clostridiales bacterium]|nr:DUF4349 domain-containing protein [Clostridiales bacterium]
MKKIKIKGLVALALLSVLFLGACSGSMNKSSSEDSKNDMDMNYGEATSGEKGDYPETAPQDTADDIVRGNGSFTSKSTVQTQDKIIRKVNMEVETKEFDVLINSINEKITELEGYVESSNVSGRSYNYNNDLRRGRIVARIPKNSLDSFTDNISDIANVINSTSDTENVTLQYVDIESRKKSLEIEQDRLWALLEKEETIEDIITLESRLSSIRYELQNYESTLRTFDNQVEYSTVTLSIYEVERTSPSSEEVKTVGNRIKTGFSDTIYNISEGLKNFAVWFVVNLPYIIIWAVIITVAVLVTKRIIKKVQVKEMNERLRIKNKMAENQENDNRDNKMI